MAVNGFDRHLEARSVVSSYRKDCLKILNEVSQGEKTPIQGLNNFFGVMKHFFEETEKSAYMRRTSKTSSREAKQKIAEYEKAGTFFMRRERGVKENMCK